MNRMICATCGASYHLDDLRWRCRCGSVLDIQFDARFDKEKIAGRKPTMWRYREAIPITNDNNIVSFEEGFTPLMEIEAWKKGLLVKMEQLFPSGSYKDRGASVLISKAKELGVKKVVEDSSGNAGCSIAAYCAKIGMECRILVPDDTSPAKTAQIQMSGADLIRVPGPREDTARATLEEAKKIYYASHSWNPFFFQGTKTYAFEIWEQLDFAAPDSLVIPTGNGTLLIGAYLGFSDLLRQGLIGSLPKMVAVQAEDCSPIHQMFVKGLREVPKIKAGRTIAEGIAIAEPVRGKQIIQIIRETGGEVITVNDEEIEQSLIELCRMGFYIEPTSASALAAFRKYRSLPGEVVVAPLTGHGLKSTEKIMKILSRSQSNS